MYFIVKLTSEYLMLKFGGCISLACYPHAFRGQYLSYLDYAYVLSTHDYDLAIQQDI